MIPRIVTHRRLAFGALSMIAWTLAGACASEGEDAGPPASGDAATDATLADIRDLPEAGEGGDATIPPPGCSDDGWCLIPLPTAEGVTLSAIWGSGASDVWAVGSAGTILHFDGGAWTALPKPDGGTKQTLFTVWGSGPNDIWAGSTERVLLHSDGWAQGQARWSLAEGSPAWKRRLDELEQAQPSGKFRVWNLWGTGASDIWMVPDDSIRCWRADGFKDGNVDWAPVLDYFPGSEINFKGIWGARADDVWIVGTQGKILRARGGYQNGLVDWQIANSGTREDLNAVWGTAADDIWTVGRVGVIRHWTYDGSGAMGWIPSSSKVDTELKAIWGSGPTDIWAVGDSSTILHGDGASWSRTQIPVLPNPVTLRGVWGSGPEDVWAVGDGVILHRGPSEVR